MLLVKSNKRKLLPACLLCALLIPLFSTVAPNARTLFLYLQAALALLVKLHKQPNSILCAC